MAGMGDAMFLEELGGGGFRGMSFMFHKQNFTCGHEKIQLEYRSSGGYK
jgi:hypothetical protein